MQNCGPAKCSTWNISGCALPCPGEVFVWIALFLRAAGGWAKNLNQSCPSLSPGGAGARGAFCGAARCWGSFAWGGEGVRAIWARGGRVSARRSTRRFGHAALPPCSLFAPRRTSRRQCRVWLGWHRAEGRAKSVRAPPCLAGLLIQARETPPGGSGARSSPRSAHQNGHFSLS